MMGYYLGIDSSTTATKALLMDGEGRLLGAASSGYDYSTPEPLWTEQEPALWWHGAAAAIQALLAKTGLSGEEIECVGLTGQMHGMVALDKNAEVLRPAILWNDQRTGAECDQIRSAIGRERFINLTGNDALTGFTAPKILWVKNHEPEIYARIKQILLPKDYLRYLLTGEYATDKAGAAGTVLFDLKKRDWSGEVIQALEINPDWLPQTFEGTEVTGTVTAQAAGVTGLFPGTPVVAGSGDQAAGAVGMGAVAPGIVSITLGTSGVVFAATPEPWIEPQGRMHAFCHALPGQWHLMGVMLSAAGSLRWFRDTLAPEIEFRHLTDLTSGVPAGSDGLFFLPYLTGERTPHPDPLAKGSFVGLTIRHTREHLTRAVLEGVAFGLRDSFELLKQTGLTEIDQVRLTGGGANSPVWRQIIADVLGVELVMVNTTEGSAFGAAILAAVGAGAYQSGEEACQAIIKPVDQIPPGPDTEIYQERYQIYKELYPALHPIFHQLG